MATKHQVIALHKDHPDWTAQQIAHAIPGECSPEYVRATAYRNGLALPSSKMGRGPLTPTQLRERAAKLIARAEEMEGQADE